MPGSVVGGKFSFTVLGDSGASYIVESSADLIHWAPLSTVVPAGGSAFFTDDNLPGDSQRFYRVTVAEQ